MGHAPREHGLPVPLHRIAEQQAIETEAPGIRLHLGLPDGPAMSSVGPPANLGLAHPGREPRQRLRIDLELLAHSRMGQEVEHRLGGHTTTRNLE